MAKQVLKEGARDPRSGLDQGIAYPPTQVFVVVAHETLFMDLEHEIRQ